MADIEEFGELIDRLRSRVLDLPPAEKSVLALASAQRVVAASTAEHADLEQVLDFGWNATQSGQGDCVAVRADLESREDLDDDPVAAVAYAIGAVGGDGADAWWAVNRLVDAAFERVPYPEDATFFRPVEEDAEHEFVRLEMSWIDETLSALERDGVTSSLVDRLRQI